MRNALLAVLLIAAAPARAARVPAPKDLSVEELAGQVFMIAIDTEIAAAREPDLRAGRVGGVILRWDKFTGEQARAMAGRLRDWSKDAPHAIPVWIAADHEGGPVFTQRLYGGAPFPGNMALGAARDADLARAAARAMARELRALGIAITFAPSVDVESNPANPIIGLRSFGEDPAQVARLGRAALRGYREGGVLAVPKHFPGHGDTSEDSHLGLPVSTKTLSALEETELVPFRAVLEGGAAAIMPAHMVFPALGTGPTQPVTLSSAALEGFLRGTLGFKGLIFSDSLEMGAIANVYGSSDAAVLSLLAGNDVLLLGKADFPSAFAAVVGAVRSGRLPRARLEESVARILKAKRDLGLFAATLPPPLPEKRLAADRALARRIAERAVTLVRDDGVLPLRLKPEQTLGLVLARSPRYPDEAARFADALRRRHARLELVDLATINPSTAAVADAVARMRGAAAVVLGTSQFGVPLPDGQRRLAAELAAGPAPLVSVSLMNPYDLAFTTRASAALCAYGITDSALDATARLLFGEIPAKGRLPVRVPGLPERPR